MVRFPLLLEAGSWKLGRWSHGNNALDLVHYVFPRCPRSAKNDWIKTRPPTMGESNFGTNFEKTSNLLNSALQLAVTTALRLVDLPHNESEGASREKVQRTSDLSVSSNLPEITFDQVSWHDHYDDCWIVLYDRVYDITEFLREHPGGADVLVEYAGRDATLAYRGFGHSAEAWKILQRYLIGVLPEEERTGIFKEEKLIGRNPQLRAASS